MKRFIHDEATRRKAAAGLTLQHKSNFLELSKMAALAFVISIATMALLWGVLWLLG